MNKFWKYCGIGFVCICIFICLYNYAIDQEIKSIPKSSTNVENKDSLNIESNDYYNTNNYYDNTEKFKSYIINSGNIKHVEIHNNSGVYGLYVAIYNTNKSSALKLAKKYVQHANKYHVKIDFCKIINVNDIMDDSNWMNSSDIVFINGNNS